MSNQMLVEAKESPANVEHSVTFGVVLVIVVAVTLLLLAVAPRVVIREVNGQFDYTAADTLSGYRWTEMAKGYERLGLLRQHESQAALSQMTQKTMALDGYRWTEMAKGYERSGMLSEDAAEGTLSQTTRQAMVLDGYRWTEMAKAYERLGLLHGSSARVNPVEAP